jgi:hypothetical protein
METAPMDVAELSYFIQGLNIFLRQLALYPAGHPQLTASCDTVLRSFTRICSNRAMISLEITSENILFDDSKLDASNMAIKNFASFLTDLNITSISFHSGLSSNELLRFCQQLSAIAEDRTVGADLTQQLRLNAISRIEIETIDYGNFQADEEDNASGPWETFITQLVGKRPPANKTINIDAIAHSLNNSDADPGGYDQLISTLIDGIAAEEIRHRDIPKRLFELVEQLKPELQQRFIQSTLRALDHQPQLANPILRAFPHQLLEDALRQQNNISSRLTDLLGQFSSNDMAARKSTTKHQQETNDAILKARIDILLLEDNHNEYVPSVYQKTLQRILNGQIRGSIPPELASELRNNLEQQSVEHQCTNVIFNMLDNGVDAEGEAIVQTSLTELTHLHLDTGDFNALRDIYVRWSHYLNGGQANARVLDETVLGTQASEQFMNEVLNSVEIWGEDKHQDISDYILEVGEPYTVLLIERLGNEEQLTRRKIWIDLLEKLGRKGVRLISQALRDERWSLTHTLLRILSNLENELIPVKDVRPLTQHEHPLVRQEALRIIFRFDPMMADRQLIKELASDDKSAIYAALEIANLSNDDKVLRQLHQLLMLDHKHDPDLQIRKKTLEVLSKLGKPQTIPLLTHLLRKKLIRSRWLKQLQRDIIETLAHYPASSVSPLLDSLCKRRNRSHRMLAKEQRLRLNAGRKP